MLQASNIPMFAQSHVIVSKPGVEDVEVEWGSVRSKVWGKGASICRAFPQHPRFWQELCDPSGASDASSPSTLRLAQIASSPRGDHGLAAAREGAPLHPCP